MYLLLPHAEGFRVIKNLKENLESHHRVLGDRAAGRPSARGGGQRLPEPEMWDEREAHREIWCSGGGV